MPTPKARTPIRSRLFLWGVSCTWFLVMTIGLAHEGSAVVRHISSLLVWVALLILISLFPVPGWKSSQFTVDLPVKVAAALVLSPLETGLVSFVSGLDRREIKGAISPTKAVFNRSQYALSDFLGSFAVHAFVKAPGTSRWIVLLGFLVLSVATLTNYVLVSLAISIEHGFAPQQVVRRLRIGSMLDFGLTFAAWAVLGAMLASLYGRIHPLALFAFLGPTFLTRQMLLRSQMVIDTSRAYRSRERALAAIAHQVSEERLDERRLIAADLHDEVLQPLFQVSIMAHVMKADLAGGRLLELDEDLPELLTAAEVASTTLRELIGDLRRSALGRGGLCPALDRFCHNLAEKTSINFKVQLQSGDAFPDCELAMYQIAKEAILNAVTHSSASHITVSLEGDETHLFLEVQDDGSGFDSATDRPGHYGLAIMRERALASGGLLFVDSDPGKGTRISAHLPKSGRTAQ